MGCIVSYYDFISKRPFTKQSDCITRFLTPLIPLKQLPQAFLRHTVLAPVKVNLFPALLAKGCNFYFPDGHVNCARVSVIRVYQFWPIGQWFSATGGKL